MAGDEKLLKVVRVAIQYRDGTIDYNEMLDAMKEAAAGGEVRIPRGVEEALQRMIEDGLIRGDASAEDARLVQRWAERITTPSDDSEWVRVPRVATREMLNAAVDVDSFKLGDISPLGFRISPQRLFEQCYAAMLSAAPAPDNKRGEGEDAERFRFWLSAIFSGKSDQMFDQLETSETPEQYVAAIDAARRRAEGGE